MGTLGYSCSGKTERANAPPSLTTQSFLRKDPMAIPTLAECSASSKTCTKCGGTHPIDAFHRSTAHKDGRRNLCRNCRRDSKRLYRFRTKASPKPKRPRPEYRYWSKIKAKYGLTEDQFKSLFEKQGSGCAICASPTPRGRLRSGEAARRFVVDHCHQTGRVRGILCNPCNSGIGILGDDPQRLRRALTYLESPSHG
jgi:hypothetical protein